ncbi:MAG: 4-(cytidine 5'-diphospho)-2-C-methyl-D-erythritol kinase [Actinomycetia bacterium]|nr:4-(cytidine 5'-diphospho)-2-C-methyl-D-erythritol kinase [Actinomycetes bacterium]
MKTKLRAFAKINLYLKVTGKRPDGYHDIKSIFQTISLFDEVSLQDSKEIQLTCNWKNLEKENLASKAANVLREYKYFPGVKINLHKSIPEASGLGGGSSDAAAVLNGLNLMWNLGLKNNELEKVALELGSDVPYFITGGTKLVEGRGEKLTSLTELGETTIILAKLPFKLSTKLVYDTYDKNNDKDGFKGLKNISGPVNGNWNKIASNMHNSLESVATEIYPIINTLKQKALQEGALGALMSGSGPSVFAICTDEEIAGKVEKSWLRESIKVLKLKTISRAYQMIDFGEEYAG